MGKGRSLKRFAEKVNRLHRGSPSTKELAPDYRLVGFAGEKCVVEALGGTWIPELNGGDKGRDIVVQDRFTSQTYSVDVKTSRLPHLGMLVGLPVRADIYVFVQFPDLCVVGWNWASVVKQFPVVDKGHGIKSHNVPVGALRTLQELIDNVYVP